MSDAMMTQGARVAPPRMPSVIREGMAAVNDEYERLNGRFYELADRLEPVLRPEAINGVGDSLAKAQVESTESPLGNQLEDLARRMSGLVDRMQGVLDRVDL